ncbi:hypothetical protein H7X87_02390 [Acetobacteraceae bacterium]|nr:hypothetical protein [Candidatus Parcubacteria bacterium]
MSKIEKNVMGSVAAIYTFRLASGFTALKFYMLLVSIAGLAFLVSLPNVVANFANVASHGVGSIAPFVLSAISGTTILVQLALLVGVFAFSLLFRDVVRSFSSRGSLFA